MKHIKQIIFITAIAIGFMFPSQAGAAWGQGHFYVIGTGHSGPRMATLHALETIKKKQTLLSGYEAKMKLETILHTLTWKNSKFQVLIYMEKLTKKKFTEYLEKKEF